jgi:hypothetical protein
MVLLGELLVRYMVPAWPFETALYMPDYLTARDIPFYDGDSHPQTDEILWATESRSLRDAMMLFRYDPLQ